MLNRLVAGARNAPYATKPSAMIVPLTMSQPTKPQRVVPRIKFPVAVSLASHCDHHFAASMSLLYITNRLRHVLQTAPAIDDWSDLAGLDQLA